MGNDPHVCVVQVRQDSFTIWTFGQAVHKGKPFEITATLYVSRTAEKATRKHTSGHA